MEKLNSQTFEMGDMVLYFDQGKSILLCKLAEKNKNLWAKKLKGINYINDIIDDPEKYYINCESDEKSGQYFAINKKDGNTIWYIPGRAFLHLLYSNFLYIIFIDENDEYYLIKVDRDDGRKIWHHKVNIDLDEYSFAGDRIQLTYSSGKKEIISLITGTNI